MNDIIDILVIGNGPAGMSAAINAVIRKKSVKIIYKDESYLKKAEKINNYLGFYNISGKSLYQQFSMHIKQMGIETIRGKVSNIIKNNDKFIVNIDGKILKSKAIILALGVYKKEEIINEKTYIGKGVSYCATCDSFLYRNKKIIVCGDSKDIIAEANYLSKIASKVILITSDVDTNQLKSNIEYISGIINEIIGDTIVRGVIIDKRKIDIDGIFILRDSVAPDLLINDLDVDCGYIKVDRNMKTNINGVFACGDCVGYPFQIAKAVGEGIVASLSASKYLEKEN